MIELSSVIRDLRDELEQAVAAAEGEALRFELGTIELEVSVALERTGQAGAKVRFWVVETDADATVAATSTQRLTLALRPTLTGPDGPDSSGSSAYVAGTAEPDES
ncbi:trypco2 family protein [Streptomyces sp. NPDC059080]|uniref:trypco2 family protein n=1 Tax=Streptomyces sp. NPDC059080 TaxID=3346718 RepID=UPI003676CA5E